MIPLKLRTKLIIGFAAFMITIMAMSGVSYSRMTSMQDEINAFYKESFAKYKGALVASNDVSRLGREIGNIIMNDGDKLNEARIEIERNKLRVDTFITWASNQVKVAGEQDRLLDIRKSWYSFMQYVTDCLLLSEQGKTKEANDMRNDFGLESQEALMMNIDRFSQYTEVMMEEQFNNSNKAYELSVTWILRILLFALILCVVITWWIIPGFINNLNTMSLMIQSLSKGRLHAIRKFKPHNRDEIGEVIEVFKVMASDLELQKHKEAEYRQQQRDQSWIDSNIAKMTELLSGVSTMQAVTQTFINEFIPALEAQYGALYIREETESKDELRLYASYASGDHMEAYPIFPIGRGLVGQCAADEQPIIVKDMKDNSLRIETGTISASPKEIALYPIIFEQHVLGVLEVASLNPISEINHQLMDNLASKLAVIVHTIAGHMKVEELLRDSQAMTEELQCQSEEMLSQQEELRRSNEYLEAQAEALRRSEEMLQRQQEELEHYNKELVSKTRAIEETMLATKQKNEELEIARTALERQTLELALASKYKSEFLANMSHELRTPLNSLLVLSQLLAENKDNNLHDKQVEYARTINMSGADLLNMIDEILDLSKIDAGQMKITGEKVFLNQFCNYMKDSFTMIAEQKDLDFKVEVDANVPSYVCTDEYRLKQIIRNLLSNAFKFTDSGIVLMHVEMLQAEDGEKILIHVRDTGVGIPVNKQKLVFEAFQQLDGTTSRKYGGTGLGLSISRELASLLGGKITVESQEGLGSIFTLELPAYLEVAKWSEAHQNIRSSKSSNIEELVRSVSQNIEQVMMDGNDVLLPALNGADKVVEYAAVPYEEIVEKVQEVEQLLVRTQHDATSSEMWMFGQLRLLIVEDDGPQRQSLIALLQSAEVSVTAASTGAEAIGLLSNERMNGMVLDLMLPDMTGFELIERISEIPETEDMPIIVYTGLTLKEYEQAKLKKRVQRVIVKDVNAPERLLQETMLLLNQLKADKHVSHQEAQIQKDPLLFGKRVLIVDDDVRNVFALSSVLEQYHMNIQFAENGREAIEQLERDENYDIVLMDMMMPEIDGYEAMRQIRLMDRFRELPIIALTAKAMKEDRKKCIEAGASDYVSKPFQTEQLLSLMRVWLYNAE